MNCTGRGYLFVAILVVFLAAVWGAKKLILRREARHMEPEPTMTSRPIAPTRRRQCPHETRVADERHDAGTSASASEASGSTDGTAA